MNACTGRSSHCPPPATVLIAMSLLLSLAAAMPSLVAQETPAVAASPSDPKPSVSPPSPSPAKLQETPQAAQVPQRPILLVRPSTVPLGDNSVIAVSPQEARQELQGIESGLFRRTLAEPKVLSVPEQGGWVRGFFKEPKASKLWSFFNPKAPLDSQTDLMRSARIFGIRGDAPLPHSLQDPVHIEPVGIRFWQINR